MDRAGAIRRRDAVALALSVLLALPGPFLVGVTYLPGHPQTPGWAVTALLVLSLAVWLPTLARLRVGPNPGSGHPPAETTPRSEPELDPEPRSLTVWQRDDRQTRLENRSAMAHLGRVPTAVWLLTGITAGIAVPTAVTAMFQLQGRPTVIGGHFYAVNHGIRIPLTALQYAHQTLLGERAFTGGAAIFLAITVATAFVTLTPAPASLSPRDSRRPTGG